jgi:trans-2,3-dihydro-3-hydroxyanthranilate isomerase
MTLDFLQIDVFASRAYTGNPLAVFHDAPELSTEQMQAIAREMNLSETTFVTETDGDSYSMRVFTPEEELPFAGHPTIGTTWVLKHLGRVKGDRIVQHTAAGPTPVVERAGTLWFERPGSSDPEGTDAATTARIAEALGLVVGDVGLDAAGLGRDGQLTPTFSDAGVRMLFVPLRDVAALEACSPVPDALAEVGSGGAYCFTAAGPGRIRARGFFPGFGVAEDPGTGVAAAGLGIFLATRLGDIDFEILQGVEIGRPCNISVAGKARGVVEVGGHSFLVLAGVLEVLP